MTRGRALRLTRGAVLLWALAASFGSVAADNANYKTSGGLTVYLGVLPAAMIQGHDKDHPEGGMHRGIPSGEHAYHVMAAVFNAETGERIEDARVEAGVAALGLTPVTQTLERMAIAGTITYGNYFTMRVGGWYRITFSITTPGVHEPVVLEFQYDHRTR